MKLEVHIPAKLRPLAKEIRGDRYRHIILRGGRGSGKSWGIARVLAAVAYAMPLRVLCTRETQKSIKESSYRLIADQLQTLGLGQAFDVQEKIIRGGAGSEFSFVGLKEHTSDSIKSYEGYDIAWIEEAHAVSDKSANVLIPTLRKPGSKLIWSYNPDQEDDYVHVLANSGRKDVLVIDINWSDNKFFPAELEIERQALKALNDDLYQHVWEGRCRSKSGILFKRRWFKRYPLGQHPKQLRIYMSTDYAGAPDPDAPEREPDWNEFGVGGMDSGSALWFVDWYSGQEDAADWLPAWLALVRKHKPLAVFEEKGPPLRMIDGTIERAMQKAGKGHYVYRHQLPSTASKADRALGFAAYASTNDVWVPECDWGDRLVNQLCAFTGQDGKVDDMVDVCSLFGRGVDEMADALPELTPEHRGVKPFTVKWLTSGDKPATSGKRY
jgi:hypothetical protein